MNRVYESPLRAEQLEQTRRRILDAAVEELAAVDVEELTIPAVARRARVSVRTVYRHFPTKDALFEGVADALSRTFGEPPFPERVEDLPAAATRLFPAFEANEGAIRAALDSRAGREALSAGRSGRVAALERVLEPLLEGRDPGERRRIVAALYTLHSMRTWFTLREYFGLTGDEAGEAVSWVVKALLAELRRDSARRKRGGGG